MPQAAIEAKNPAPEQQSKSAPELMSLEVLIGNWRNNLEFKNNPDNKGTGSITYEWLEGDFISSIVLIKLSQKRVRIKAFQLSTMIKKANPVSLTFLTIRVTSVNTK